ncbi:LacI family DNA-binding transcriptional regulator [Streptomyces cavernae]|uniref:LacI family DNA-binding transcriptional regulator n=1 Tax=Streptomyces cavernae TaxID=2259034 RepID=UPI000FEBE638|nr:LacI family DNA-binding transcriptional regulator [Streptomyces cavernae]
MPVARRPTLSDVAQEVGVSAKTVSRVLNEDGPVSAETRERVLEAVKRLGFRPNLMARHMRLGMSDTAIGLIVPDMSNPFFATVVSGIESVTHGRGLTLLVGSSAQDADRERSLVGTFLARRVSALLMAPTPKADHGYLKAERSAGLPVVFLDRPGTALTADSVLSSNRRGAGEGTAHLIRHGHRRIGFVGAAPAAPYTRRMRLQGYRDALAEAGLRYDKALVVGGQDVQDAADATERLLALADPPTALLAANNFSSMGAVLGLARTGRRDVALVGFDDIPLAEALEPALTVVAQDPAAMGAAAATTALARLDGDRSRARSTEIPTRLIPRGSGELRPR